MLKFGYKLGQVLEAVDHGSPSLMELSDNKGRFSLGYEPTREELFQASRGKKRKCNTSGMFIPHLRTTFLALVEVIMPEPFKELEDEEPDLACIIRLYPKEFSLNTIISLEDNLISTIWLGMPGETAGLWTIKPSLFCGCTSWVKSIPSSSDWTSRSPERDGIAYLVCFACLCYFLLYLYSLFISPICFPRKKKFPYIIIKHELCFPFTLNPLMKYLVYYSGNSCISLLLLSYEYVCANCLMFLCICSSL